MPAPILLRTDRVSKVFGHGPAEVKAVDGATFELRAGEFSLIMGPSGSGKTTLLSMLGGLLRPTSGRIFLDGQDITHLSERDLPGLRGRKIGFIFQAFNLLEALTVEQNILLPSVLAPRSREQAHARALDLMRQLGLTARGNALPSTLSGGEKQRVAIARALINDPKIILADEPTGNLDSQKGQEVVMLLKRIAQEDGKAVLLVTHDPRVEDVADRILWLEDGKLSDRKSEPRSWVRDPVCGMRVDGRNSPFRAEHGGSRFSFCSDPCRNRFLQSPADYAAPADGKDR